MNKRIKKKSNNKDTSGGKGFSRSDLRNYSSLNKWKKGKQIKRKKKKEKKRIRQENARKRLIKFVIKEKEKREK